MVGSIGQDLVAGATVALLLIPQGMAYALLAGLPPEVGLYAAVVTPLVYALAGGSRHIAIGPVAITSIMVATSLADQPADQFVAGAVVLAAESGLVLLLMRAFRLGVLVNFVSLPVLCGFSNGTAIAIICSQLPAMFGLPLVRSSSEPIGLASFVVAHLGDTNPYSLAASLAALLLLFLGKRPLRNLLVRVGISKRSAAFASRVFPLLVIMSSMWAELFTDAHVRYGIQVVGALPDTLPMLSAWPGNWQLWLDLLPSAALLALINYVGNITIGRQLAARSGDRIRGDVELLALGITNIASAALALMPVAGSFSRSLVNFDAGARTRLAGVLSALIVAIFCLTSDAWIAHLPQAVLAGMITLAAVQTIDIQIARRILAADRADGLILAATALAVVVAGVEIGLFIGIFLGISLHLKRTSQPHLVVLGRVNDTELFRNVDRPDVTPTPGILIVRVDENLYFANIDAIEGYIQDRLRERTDTRFVVLALSAVNLIDSSAADQLALLDDGLRRDGIELHLSDVKRPVLAALQPTRLGRRLGTGRIHRSTHVAVGNLEHRR